MRATQSAKETEVEARMTTKPTNADDGGAEPRGSLNMFPDLWMTAEEYTQWSAFHRKEDIKAERVEGFSEEERLAYRLGVDEAIWFVAMPKLAALEASRPAQDIVAEMQERLAIEIHACEALEEEFKGRSKKEFDDNWICADEVSHRMGGLKFALGLIAILTTRDSAFAPTKNTAPIEAEES